MKNDFLVEIGCEELPPKALQKLSKAFATSIQEQLAQAGIDHGEIKSFASPRRLAVIVFSLEGKQPDQSTEKKGPALAAAFDKEGNPTQACLGFARSCGVDVSELEQMETDKGPRLVFQQKQAGQPTPTLLPEMVNKALQALPIPKRMRWGNYAVEFVRPVHWLVMLWGEDPIACEILGQQASNVTYGHRFLAPEAISINHPKNYATLLKEQGKVIVDFDERMEAIEQQVKSKAAQLDATAIIDSSLLNEVTGIVEWPVPLAVSFDNAFLAVPPEALITAMQHHQKCFPVTDSSNQLLPHFITISNIESKYPEQVIKGNQRVMSARLSDAQFFFENDLKNSLATYHDQLKHVLFKEGLGSLYDRSLRIAKLASYIAKQLHSDQSLAEQAGHLCKADLMSEMVGEFPELQGIMGYYYASDLPQEVALTMKEHYLPRFSGDKLPTSNTGCAVAIADRLDSIVGIFGINQPPSGEKDPFGLRRAALGLLRIMVEKQLDLDLNHLLQEAHKNYKTLPNATVTQDSFAFILERLRSWYQDQGIPNDVFSAVMAKKPASPLDFQNRINAVNEFRQLPEAKALAAANKRVSKLLIKEGKEDITRHVQGSLLENNNEKQLAKLIHEKRQQVDPLYANADYTQALTQLANLRDPVDCFFDNVMVMADDPKLRNNRLALLANLRDLFLQVADISELQ